MKILKRPIFPEIKCGCGTVFKVGRKDLNVHLGNAMVFCPICREMHIVFKSRPIDFDDIKPFVETIEKEGRR